MKNTDAALARILALAAERAECELYAAIVHIEEYGAAEFAGSVAGSWGWDEPDDDDWEMGDVDDSSQWLDGWVDRDGGQPPFGEIEILPAELLPRGALDDTPPDQQWVHEASGNAGVSIERAYRRAAFVLWPRPKTLAIVASGGIDGAVAWVAEELDRNAAGADERIRALTARLIDIWPSGRDDRDAQGRARMLRLLCTTGTRTTPCAFCARSCCPATTAARTKPWWWPGHDRTASGAGFPARRGRCASPAAAHGHACAPSAPRRGTRRIRGLRLGRRTAGRRSRGPAGVACRVAARAGGERRAELPRPVRFGDEAIHSLFALAWRRGLTGEAATAAGAVAAQPRIVAPDRTLPAALGKLYAEEGTAGSSAFALLWRHAADFLLARSAGPPAEPRDWAIAANVGCRCEHCQRLRAFCEDPVARTARFPLRKDLRAHLHQIIDRHRLDIEHVTERRGRPFTLVCAKTRASHQRRLAEYAEDVSCMRGLIRSAPDRQQAARCAADLARLRAAVAASARG